MLSNGTKLGWYEIRSYIGAGGMGEVYRAADVKLGRDVAVKVLRPDLAADHALVGRFAREAKVLASLNHSNIAQIYGVEDSGSTPALVMEFVPGDSLSSLIRRGRLPLPIVLNYARQIMEALAAAHEKGIIHRDLKPANIMVTPEGVIKILDFGLAAMSTPTTITSGETVTVPYLANTVTEPGILMGTVGYMSPEQATGLPIDRRTDIWAFGVVLWEMATGKPLFEGSSFSQILAAVLTKDCQLEEAPWKLRRLLQSCLQRKTSCRLRDIGDANLLIEEQDGPIASIPDPRHNGWWRWIASASAIVAIAAFLFFWHSTHSLQPKVIRFDVDLGADLDPGDRFAISPDGSSIGFIGIDSGSNSTLFIRRLDQAKATVLDDSLGRGIGAAPFFSPDSKWIGYAGAHKLKKVWIAGGVPIVIADGLVGPAFSTWGANGDIVSALTYAGVSLIHSAGGSPGLIYSVYPMEPSFLPGGRSVILSGGPISILPIEVGQARLLPGIVGSGAKYIPVGYLLYVDEHAILQALPFDANHLQAKGSAFPLLDGISSFDISSEGTLICRRARFKARVLKWLDKAGNTEAISQLPESYATPRVSADGNRLAYSVRGDKGSQIWTYDLTRHASSQLTFENITARYPLWMPGGETPTLSRSRGPFRCCRQR